MNHEFLEMIDDRFYIQIVTKATVNCSLNHGYDHGATGINYDEVDEYIEHVDLMITDLTNHQMFQFHHINYMSDAQLYMFILEQIEQILEEDE